MRRFLSEPPLSSLFLPSRQLFSNFPHDCIGNNLLCFAITEDGFPIFKSYVDGTSHIKRQFVQKCVVCFFCGGSLYLRNYVCYALLHNLLCNLRHLPAVFFCIAAVSILIAPIAKISVFVVIILLLSVQILHCSSCWWWGWVLGMAQFPSLKKFCARPQHCPNQILPILNVTIYRTPQFWHFSISANFNGFHI